MLLYLLSVTDGDEDKTKLTALYHQYHRLALHIAVGILNDPLLAEDAVQDAFERLIRHLHKIRDVSSHKTRSFVVIITRSASLDLLSREQRRRHIYWDDIEELPQSDTFGFGHVETEHLLKAIKKLPEPYRDVLQLKAQQELTDKEIAAALNLSGPAVRKRLQRARRILSDLLNEQDG